MIGRDGGFFIFGSWIDFVDPPRLSTFGRAAVAGTPDTFLILRRTVSSREIATRERGA
jgi:hypothetical protein